MSSENTRYCSILRSDERTDFIMSDYSARSLYVKYHFRFGVLMRSRMLQGKALITKRKVAFIGSKELNRIITYFEDLLSRKPFFHLMHTCGYVGRIAEHASFHEIPNRNVLNRKNKLWKIVELTPGSNQSSSDNCSNYKGIRKYFIISGSFWSCCPCQ